MSPRQARSQVKYNARIPSLELVTSDILIDDAAPTAEYAERSGFRSPPPEIIQFYDDNGVSTQKKDFDISTEKPSMDIKKPQWPAGVRTLKSYEI
mmetsp:Transcript_17885/g.21922  ORF Transcript_17885/g.21922 Transcript_17885/m.21922 type:complete len:95 (+) Transcript_17885:2470-2754(+)